MSHRGPLRSALTSLLAAAWLVAGGTGCGLAVGATLLGIQAGKSDSSGGFVPAPTVTSVSPGSAPHAGGETVTVSGSNFPSDAAVSVGGVTAPSVTFRSGSTLDVVLPRLEDTGPQDVVVTNPAGGSGTLADGIDYTNTTPTAEVNDLAGPLAGNVVVEFRLFDDESDDIDITFEVDADGDGDFEPIPEGLIVSGSTSGLASSPQAMGGVLHNVTWDSNETFPSENAASVQVRIVPVDTVDGQTGTPGPSNAFAIENNVPVGVELVQPSDDAFRVALDYVVTESDADTVEVTRLRWRDIGDARSGDMTVVAGQGLGVVPASAGGSEVFTVWDSREDLGFGNNRLVTVTVEVSDGSNTASATSDPFFVNNGPLADQVVVDAFIDVMGVAVGDVVGDDGIPDIVACDSGVDDDLLNTAGTIATIRNRGLSFENAALFDLATRPIPGAVSQPPPLGSPLASYPNFFLTDRFFPSEATAIDGDGDGVTDLVVASSVHGPFTQTVTEFLRLLPTRQVFMNAGFDRDAVAPLGLVDNTRAHQVTYRVTQTAGGVLDVLGAGVFESSQAERTRRAPVFPVDPPLPTDTNNDQIGWFTQDLLAAELDDPSEGGGEDLVILQAIANIDQALDAADMRGAVVVRKRGAGGLAGTASSAYLDIGAMGAAPVHCAVADITSAAHDGSGINGLTGQPNVFPVAPNPPVRAGLPDVVVVNGCDASLSFFVQTASAADLGDDPDLDPGQYFGQNLGLQRLVEFLSAVEEGRAPNYANEPLPAGDLRGVALGDLNGDGADDLVVSTQSSGRLFVFVYDDESAGPLSLNFNATADPATPAPYADGSGAPDSALLVPLALPFRLAGFYELDGLSAGRPAIEDLTGDGRAEVIVPLGLANEVFVYANQGNLAPRAALGETHATPLFGPIDPANDVLPPTPEPVRFTSEFIPFEVAVADLNGDRRDDVVAAAGLSFDFSVFYEASPGTLDRFFAVPAGGSPFIVQAADLDASVAGREVAVSLTNQNAISVFRRSAGSLATLQTYDVDGPNGVRGLPPYLVAPQQPFLLNVGDLDDDGAEDDIVAATNILVQGEAIPDPPPPLPPQEMQTETVAGWVGVVGGDLAADIGVVRSTTFAPVGFAADLGDFIGPDGIPDVVVSTAGGLSGIDMHRGLGGGDFAGTPSLIQFGSINSVLSEDVDGDGLDDVLLATNSAAIGVRAFWGGSATGAGGTPTAGDFGLIPVTSGGTSLGPPVGLVVADLGGPTPGGVDLPDIIITGFTNASAGILFQTAPRTFGILRPLVVGGEPAQPAVGDLNDDGLVDIALPWGKDDLLAVYYQNPAASAADLSDLFFGPTTFETANTPVGCGILDVDGDGRNDVVVAARGANSLNVFLQR